MVGLIPKLFLDWIRQTGGAEAEAQVRAKAGIPEDRLYRIDVPYDDEEWVRMFRAGQEVLGVEEDHAESAFAKYFYHDALTRWPTWFEISPTARHFIERQPVIHNGFARSAQTADGRDRVENKFSLEKHPHRLVMRYRSSNRLCGFYRALATLILRHYGESAEIEEVCCVKSGDPECEIHIRWAEAQAA